MDYLVSESGDINDIKMEKTPAELEAEKQAAEDAANNVDGAEANGGAGDDDAGADVEKKDYSNMSDEDIIVDLKAKHPDATADQLFSELAKQTKIIGHKNRAINSLKKPKSDDTKIVEQKPTDTDDLDKPITKRDLLEQNNKLGVQALINSETAKPEEKEAIMNAYENDIVKSGDIAKDFKKALAIASLDVIDEYRKNRSKATEAENEMTNFSSGGSYTGGGSSSSMSGARATALAKNLKNAGFTQEEIDAELAKK